MERTCLTCNGPIDRHRNAWGRITESHGAYRRRLHCEACVSGIIPEARLCAHCGAPMQRRRRPDGSLSESAWHFARRRFCSTVCGDAGRAPIGTKAERDRMARVRQAIAARNGGIAPSGNSGCFKCSGTEALLYHHRDGDWTNNRPENLTPICIRCRV